jgi:hypothetical protein
MIANPQAMAALSIRRTFAGSDELGAQVDADTWFTPRWILLALGKFDLDPCACEIAPHWVANRAFVKADDGLKRDWDGRVFMNPPFSNTVPWIEKHAKHGIGISLVPASVESRVWRKCVWPKANRILLLHGRTRFCNPDGSVTTGRPLRPIALIAWSFPDAQILNESGVAGVLLHGWRQV